MRVMHVTDSTALANGPFPSILSMHGTMAQQHTKWSGTVLQKKMTQGIPSALNSFTVTAAFSHSEEHHLTFFLPACSSTAIEPRSYVLGKENTRK